jgi:2-phosphoglycerate kinase
MKELTKNDIINIVKEANQETLEEYFPSIADQEVAARKENLERYQSFVEGAKNFLDQIIEKAKGEYENGIIDNSDIDYLINDQCERAMDAVGYVKSSLIALRDQGIKPSETGPTFPATRYEE